MALNPTGRVVLTARDRQIIDTTIRLGTATSAALQALHAPGIRADTFRDRLRALASSGYLKQTPHIGPAGCIRLYTAGRAALVPGQPRPWQPPLAQLEHTLAITDTLLALLHPALAPDLLVTGWQGEAELRAWEQPGHPRPDLRIHWQLSHTDTATEGRRPDDESRCGWLEVEVDRGTEARGAWRRKLARYLTYLPTAQMLTVTTSDTRARHIAELGHATGTRMLALHFAALAAGGDPVVYDAAHRRRHPLTAALRAN
jgi:hypothetical protein